MRLIVSPPGVMDRMVQIHHSQVSLQHPCIADQALSSHVSAVSLMCL